MRRRGRNRKKERKRSRESGTHTCERVKQKATREHKSLLENIIIVRNAKKKSSISRMREM